MENVFGGGGVNELYLRVYGALRSDWDQCKN